MPDPEDYVSLLDGGFKDPAFLDDDEQNLELPAETDPATGTPLDELINDEVVLDYDDDEDDDVDSEEDDGGAA